MADPVAVPAVGEDAVDVVEIHDLAVHLGHEVEVVGAEGAGDPQLGVGPVAPGLAVGEAVDPLGVGVTGVLVHRVGVGAGDHRHAHPAAAGHEVPKGIGVAQPAALVVEGDLCRVVAHVAAGREHRAVGVGAAEVVEPEVGVEAPRVVLHQRELGPAHRALERVACSLLFQCPSSGGQVWSATPLSASSPAKWQAAWWPPPTSRSAGASVRQRSWA